MEKIDETINSDCSQSETDNSPTKCLNSPTTVPDSQNKLSYNLKELGFQLQLHEIKTKDINQDSTSDQDDMTPKVSQEQAAQNTALMPALPIIPKSKFEFSLPPKCPLDEISFI